MFDRLGDDRGSVDGRALSVQETWDNIDRYVVISADTHGGADLREYKQYLPSRWHDEFDAWADAYVSPWDDFVHATASRNWDSDLRLQELDDDGVAAEVLIANTIPPFFPTSALLVVGLPKTPDEYEHRWAGLQAHNRWQADFVSRAPKRRRALLQVLPNRVEDTVAEIRWAKETNAFGGLLLNQVPAGNDVEPFFHSRYEPIWQACAELDFPVVQHNGTAPEMPMDQPASITLALLKNFASCGDMLVDMIFAGVFERYPELKLVATEAGVALLFAAQAIDSYTAAMKADAPNRTMGLFGGPHVDQLSLPPSGYVKRQVYFACSAHTATPEIYQDMRDEIGVDHLMWGSDYPHEEGTAPQSHLAYKWLFAPVPEADVRKILAGNAAEVYGFDLDALVPIAKRVGPRVADVHTPLTAADVAATPNPIGEFVERPFAGGALLDRGRPATSSF
ncbi:MAG: amidohydrolase [Actinomycetia bacterium]|nr:amidohydrolase [Actinomycetes bacterium]